ncbi:hypothetical protein PR003_g26735 [Phytophthora rubi]|uniref:Uncharacterized protein n=1 Tax=Phytophthora rubi TaxID=129364 RepID=A0A6A3HYP1_9STRA|nr:hypothetical protein PR002_g25983 [Phytophthora rubi]KAE9284903.1 hypothetical protein PR003_g26735 [Phytophthora rubi]
MSQEKVLDLVRRPREEYSAKFAAGEVTPPAFWQIKRP